MDRPRSNKLIVYGLWANAALLAIIAVLLLSKPGMPTIVPSAMAQFQQPIAGGSGIYIMPGQISERIWGCYLLDVEAKTLVAYQYNPGEKLLRLAAARNFNYDRRLGNFNTSPAPQEVADLLKKEQQVNRVVGSRTAPTTTETPPKD